MASGQWAKEDELRSLKAQVAELDRKIALTLAPVEEAEGAGEEMKQKENVQQQPKGGDNTPDIYGTVSYTGRLILLGSPHGFPP